MVKRFTGTSGLIRHLVVGAFALVASVFGGNAEGGVIYLKNNTATSGIGTSSLFFQNISGATEGYGYGDSSFSSSPYSNALEIYTTVEGNKLSSDSRPLDTLGWNNISLGVKGSFTNTNNYLRYAVTNTTDLAGRVLRLSDTSSLFAATYLIMDAQYHNITLPNLTHGAGVYDTLRLDVIQPTLQVNFMHGSTVVSSSKVIYSSDGTTGRTDASGNYPDASTSWTKYNGVNGIASGNVAAYTVDVPCSSSANRLATDSRLISSDTSNVLVSLAGNNATDPNKIPDHVVFKSVDNSGNIVPNSYFSSFGVIQAQSGTYKPIAEGVLALIGTSLASSGTATMSLSGAAGGLNWPVGDECSLIVSPGGTISYPESSGISVIDGAQLYVTSADAIAPGTFLTIGDSGSVVLASGLDKAIQLSGLEFLSGSGSASGSSLNGQVKSVPEPGTLAMLLGVGLGLGYAWRRRRRRSGSSKQMQNPTITFFQQCKSAGATRPCGTRDAI